MAQSKQTGLHGWLTLAANVGVVLGLVVLIFEIRQDASLTRLSVETGKNELLAAIEFSLADPSQTEVWIKSYRSPELMTEYDIKRVESHLVALMLQWDYMFQMEARGLVTIDEVRNHVSNTAPAYFGSRFAKAWFAEEMRYWRGTRMSEIAVPIVADLDPDYLQKRYSGLLELAQETAGKAEQ